MTSKVVLGKKCGLGTSEACHILGSNSFHDGFNLVSGPQWVIKSQLHRNSPTGHM